LEGLAIEDVGVFYGLFFYFKTIWYILWPFGTYILSLFGIFFTVSGILYQEKSGNPGHIALCSHILPFSFFICMYFWATSISFLAFYFLSLSFNLSFFLTSSIRLHFTLSLSLYLSISLFIFLSLSLSFSLSLYLSLSLSPILYSYLFFLPTSFRFLASFLLLQFCPSRKGRWNGYVKIKERLMIRSTAIS
jgi:hypothetical protein